MTWANSVLEQAHANARKAINEEIATNGPENPNAFDCGFAWVHVEDGRCKFVKECRQELSRHGFDAEGQPFNIAKRNSLDHSKTTFFGSRHYKKGWQFWKPGRFDGQSIRIHEAGARAFAETLCENGVDAYASSRLD